MSIPNQSFNIEPLCRYIASVGFKRGDNVYAITTAGGYQSRIPIILILQQGKKSIPVSVRSIRRWKNLFFHNAIKPWPPFFMLSHSLERLCLSVVRAIRHPSFTRTTEKPGTIVGKVALQDTVIVNSSYAYIPDAGGVEVDYRGNILHSDYR